MPHVLVNGIDSIASTKGAVLKAAVAAPPNDNVPVVKPPELPKATGTQLRITLTS